MGAALTSLASKGCDLAKHVQVKHIIYADVERDKDSIYGDNISDDGVDVKGPGGEWMSTCVVGGKNYEDSGLQVVSTDSIHVITSNADGRDPETMSLADVLHSFGTLEPMQSLCMQSGLSLTRLEKASYNVDICFVPASRDVPVHARATTFSHSAEDGNAQNLILVANTQGLGLFPDASNEVPLYMQADPKNEGVLHNYDWVVKPNLHGTTLKQCLEGRTHTAEQKQAVANLGEATQQVIGPSGSPETAGVLIIKLPLRKKPPPPPPSPKTGKISSGAIGKAPKKMLCTKGAWKGACRGRSTKDSDDDDSDDDGGSDDLGDDAAVMASVSRGDDMGEAKLITQLLQPSEEDAVYVKQQLWVTFEGSAPTEEDVKRALLLRSAYLETAKKLGPGSRELGSASGSSRHDDFYVQQGVTKAGDV